MKRVFRSVTAVIILAASCLPALRGQEASPTPKLARADLEAQFKKVEAVRTAAKSNTKERADAAKAAMQTASDIAWLAFDEGKFGEAASWFAKSANLKDESQANARGYWEEYLRTTAVELDGKMEGQIKELEGQLTTAEEAKKPIIRQLIHGWEKLRYTNRYNAVTMLQQIARDNNHAANLLKNSSKELPIRGTKMPTPEK